MTNTRPIWAIAQDIRKDWKNVSPYALPYLTAMCSLESVEDNYGWDSAVSIIRYFLANAGTWRGENAKRIKAELKTLCR